MSERIETLVIGDELLDGRVTDTNSVRFARLLAERGKSLARRVTVTDDVAVIVDEARRIAERGTSLCLVSGGLGPTTDDLTAEAFAQLAGVELVRDRGQVAKLERLLAHRGRAITENQLKQADRPQGSLLIDNARGTAPGFSLSYGDCLFVCLPGVPAELDAMVEAYVLPLLGGQGSTRRRSLFTFGLIEAEVDARLQPVADRFASVRFGFRATFPEIHVTLSASSASSGELDDAWRAARAALGEAVYSDVQPGLPRALLEALRQERATLAVAESCTGGLVADLLTDVAGSSDVLVAAVVAYANRAKESLLGVARETLSQHGAVSDQTVLEMARGVRRIAAADFGIATSGVAGPGGGTPDKPVGTVWIAAAGEGFERTRRLHFPFERRRNKVASAYAALELLRRQVKGSA